MVAVFDLDDTLYDEIDFVRSGFKAVSNFLGKRKYFEFLWEDFLQNGSGRNFDKLITKFNLLVSKEKLISIYKYHFPNICLPKESIEILSSLDKIAIITDGDFITQKNKILSLGLKKYVNLIVFSDIFGLKKPNEFMFKVVMDYFDDNEFIYVGDNPKKDFLAPLSLGWKVIRFKNPRGIYKNIEFNGLEVCSRDEIKEFL